MKPKLSRRMWTVKQQKRKRVRFAVLVQIGNYQVLLQYFIVSAVNIWQAFFLWKRLQTYSIRTIKCTKQLYIDFCSGISLIIDYMLQRLECQISWHLSLCNEQSVVEMKTLLAQALLVQFLNQLNFKDFLSIILGSIIFSREVII